MDNCLDLKRKFERPPKVKLLLLTRVPPDVSEEVGTVDVVASAAYQCYSPGVAEIKPRPDQRAHDLAQQLNDGGHDTTRQHFSVTYTLDDITRAVVHDIFHAHKFYNSDQQSQRYAKIEVGGFQVPTTLTGEQRKLFIECATYANTAFTDLEKDMLPEVLKRMHLIYPKPGWEGEKRGKYLREKADKLNQEVRRYLLPIAQFTTMVHTLNELELLRLYRTSRLYGATDESKYVIAEMVNQLAQVDPTFLEELRKPLESNRETYGDGIKEEYAEQRAEFDSYLDDGNTKLRPFSSEDARSGLARTVRSVLGITYSRMSDEEALKKLMDPSVNKLLADVHEPGINDHLSIALRTVSVTYDTKLSHTADSQRQRHRETPGTMSLIARTWDGEPDYITPKIIRENRVLLDQFCTKIEGIFRRVSQCVDASVPLEYALLLLPNALTLRVTESGDLLDWFHRFKQRSCFRAQEEISFNTFDQMKQLLEELPEAKMILQAPCGVRQTARITPYCPEGKDYCGVPVHRLELDEYAQRRLI